MVKAISSAADSSTQRQFERASCEGTHGPHPMAGRAAATNCALLLTGETGTGKGYLARWIHEHSARRGGPFVPVNCGAVPESLIDSHLFGHARGAFSGANCDHQGLIRAAAGGTLLLDEICELPMSAQLRLLRLLEEREVQPVGYSKPVVVDVRIIAATNGDPLEAVRQRKFREDLHFRLDVVRLHMSPLRERAQQVPSLLEAFNHEFARLYQQPELTFDRRAEQELIDYHWPGNVRELRSVVERLHVFHGGSERAVTCDDLSRFAQMQRASNAASAWGAHRVAELKLHTVNQALSAHRGNVSRAASTLGVHRSTIYRWLAQAPISA